MPWVPCPFMPVEHTNPTASPGSWSSSSTRTRELRSKELNSQLEPAWVGVGCPEVVIQVIQCLSNRADGPEKKSEFCGSKSSSQNFMVLHTGGLGSLPPEQPPQRLFPLVMCLWPEHWCEGWQHWVCACTREDNLNPSTWGLSPQPGMGNTWFQCWLVVFASGKGQGYTPVGWDSHTGTEQGSILARAAFPPLRVSGKPEWVTTNTKGFWCSSPYVLVSC